MQQTAIRPKVETKRDWQSNARGGGHFRFRDDQVKDLALVAVPRELKDSAHSSAYFVTSASVPLCNPVTRDLPAAIV